MDTIDEPPGKPEDGAKGFSHNAVHTDPGQQPWRRTGSPGFGEGRLWKHPSHTHHHCLPLSKLRDISKFSGLGSVTFYPQDCFIIGGGGGARSQHRKP